MPWPAAPFVTYALLFEGQPGIDPRQYGVRFKFDNFTLETCTVCGPTTWRYTVYYSFPSRAAPRAGA
jgi:hypothetical protein